MYTMHPAAFEYHRPASLEEALSPHLHQSRIAACFLIGVSREDS